MSRLTLPVEVEWKAAAGSSTGELEGYASVFGTVDLEGDVVMPGAFRKTIADWNRAARPLPLIADHQLTTEGLIGSVHHLAEKAKGLFFRARFGSTQKAQDVRSNVLGGHLRGASFTYEPLRTRPGSGEIGGKAVRRFLDELRLFEITVSPFPIHPETDLAAKAVTNKPWDGSPSRFTDEQYQRSCLIDRGGDDPVKQRCSLPVREPNGDVNRNAVHAAAAALAGGRGGVQASAEQKASAARKLIRLYGELDEDPPDSLRRMAGRMSSAQTEWADAMAKALAIPHEAARKAAVEELVADYPVPDLAAVLQDADDTATDAADGETAGTSEPPAEDPDAYALTFLNQGPTDGSPNGTPPTEAPPAPIADLERDRFNAEADALEAELAALGGPE